MEPWYSGAVADAIREAKSRQALFIVYVRDDSEQSKSMDILWLDVWNKLNNSSNIIAIRIDENTEACNQFTAIYKVEKYPTIYLINCQNGQVLKKIDQLFDNADQLKDIIEEGLNTTEPKQEQPVKSVEERVAEARARLKEIHDKREEEIKEKDKQDEMNRRRLGQQMLLDKQKKDEELIRKQAEDIRREKLEQQKLQEKLKAQIEQDREEKRRKYEQEQSPPATTQKPKSTTKQNIETPKVNYTRSRLQFRLTDGSFFTEDFPIDAHINDVYAYLQETLPTDQYKNGAYILRTTHTRVTLTRDNPSTLKDLELVPSAVLLVINRAHVTSPSINSGSNSIFQSTQFIFAWFMMQFNLIYQFIFAKLYGNRAQTPTPSASSTTEQMRRRHEQKSTKKENFRSDSTENSTIRRFHNTQDDDDDEEKRTWNGNSTQQM